jgi:hypothetical protein
MATIKVYVGGIVLIVQRELAGEEGLYLLMAHDHKNTGGMLHKPQVLYEDASGARKTIDLKGKDLDLRQFLTGGTKRQKLLHALPISGICGTGKVSAAILRGGAVNPVDAKVILPLPAQRPTAASDTVDVHSIVGGTKTLHKAMAGILAFEYETTKPLVIDSTTIPGDFYLVNIPDNQLPKPSKANDRMPHPEMHFDLIKGCQNLHQPELRAAEDYPKPGMAMPKARIFWVNPVECTVGFGCPELEPDCGEG